MAWISIRGLTGKIYVPDPMEEKLKKHPCPGCFSCQQCGDDRCAVCRKRQEPEDSENTPNDAENP